MDTLVILRVYKELADWYERQGQPAMRDRFLILAAESAFAMGKIEEAERLRQHLLHGNPHHMLKPFSSFAQAMQSSNVQIYIHDLQVNYPPETAEDLLRNLRAGAEPAASIPQTAPLIGIHDEPTLLQDSPVEPLKVYPLCDEPEVTNSPEREATNLPEPAVKPTHLNRPPSYKKPAEAPAVNAPARPSKLNPPTPRAQPVIPRQSTPLRSARPGVVSDPSPLLPPTPEPAPSGAWLTLLLFGMTVTAGVALAACTLLRPFAPAHWLP
jgi:hypothetical protein